MAERSGRTPAGNEYFSSREREGGKVKKSTYVHAPKARYAKYTHDPTSEENLGGAYKGPGKYVSGRNSDKIGKKVSKMPKTVSKPVHPKATISGKVKSGTTPSGRSYMARRSRYGSVVYIDNPGGRTDYKERDAGGVYKKVHKKSATKRKVK